MCILSVIRSIIYPLRTALGENLIFMMDNAPQYRTRKFPEGTRKVPEEGHITRIPCPANLPDQNPIEMKNALRNKHFLGNIYYFILKVIIKCCGVQDF